MTRPGLNTDRIPKGHPYDSAEIGHLLPFWELGRLRLVPAHVPVPRPSLWGSDWGL